MAPNFPYYFLLGLIPTLLFLQHLWISPSTLSLWKHAQLSINKTLSSSSKRRALKSSLSTLTSLFYLIAILNITGLLSFTPSLTSHLLVTLRWGGILWTSIIIYIFLHKTKLTLTTQTPENTPNILAPFLSLVEGVSHIIRPLTLSFRLGANITAGHVILGMMASTFSFSLIALNPTIFILIGITNLSYFSFEIAIAIIQAFVLILLTYIYRNDYIHRK